MKMFLTVIISSSILLFGCYLPIKGQVVDAETMQPIEGAIVMVEWTKKHGFGDAWTESYKVVEMVSDKDGNVKIPGCYSPFVEPPDVTVYKKGYVAWNDEIIFPGYRVRTDFQWQNYIFKLAKLKDSYSYIDHTNFILFSINASLNMEAKQKINKAFSWEEDLASKERDKKVKPRP